ncbi:hypothetical protein EUGRSUZ_D00917 [Eucalyptus grandis]|uniref:non-specific serine/threonine protein kinase n=1 Tax=Eucalyptus grandis TaxID=71139 RepID=A0A059CE60_EUCGR|nr:hypothetical protein EUGRSUZ_D00917 [Eucalyptus grandis]
MNTRTVSLHILVLFLLLHSTDSSDTLAPNDTLKDGDVLISQGRKFALGFFSPGKSTSHYLGIWYYGQPEQTVVWVANREHPLNGTSGVLALDRYGNLAINANNGSFLIWSANVSSLNLDNSTTAQLLDSGNLVLKHDLSKMVVWQSFDYPTDTYLPSMKLGLDRRAGLDRFVTSWKSEARYRKKSTFVKKAMVALSVSALLLLLLGSLMYCRMLKRKRADRRGRNPLASGTTSSAYFNDLPGLKDLNSEGRQKKDLPLFDFKTVAAATNNFSSVNELGQGGFGSVYKGVMNHGTEIAVKRLSKYSGQGNEEFKNEVRLIAKLQHRNLVKIIGCCIQEDEKLLIYEYLPNNSLDSFLFDDTRRSLLDWEKRFEIAYGVARGLMYLHQDSSLRIIHRDLKASNVLLDVALNPKISDFGMARICRGDQIEGKTKRVVGTYGYMAPEYALQGRFSIKSDVYSYGVLLLEIITGQRNNGCYHMSPFCNLIDQPLHSHFHNPRCLVWELWKEGKCTDIVDRSMDNTYSEEMVLRCIQIGLLCVQRYALDRPTMSTVVFMLGNADVLLPSPKQPAFIDESARNNIQLTCNRTCSVNGVTISVVEAR